MCFFFFKCYNSIVMMEGGIFLTKKIRRAEQPKVRQRKHIAFRMNLLFFSIFILFSILILRLGYLQIVKSEDYVMALERTEEVSVNTSVPRGESSIGMVVYLLTMNQRTRLLIQKHPRQLHRKC